ncbi:MAG: DUF805 domain-containing protein [Hyphomonadaceae bacterium]|nr:DUF805 domain-containing protein [Hyphomonadaceae bacterium]
MTLIRSLFSWHGRIRGGQFFFWLFGASLIASAGSMVLTQTLIPIDPESGGRLADSTFWVLWWAGQLPGTIAIASLLARRLHDLGYSARWLMPAGAYVFLAVLASTRWDMTNTLLGAAISIPVVAAMICLLVAPGEPRENRYGPAPTA